MFAKKWGIKEKKKEKYIQIFCKKRTKRKKEEIETEENSLKSIQIWVNNLVKPITAKVFVIHQVTSLIYLLKLTEGASQDIWKPPFVSLTLSKWLSIVIFWKSRLALRNPIG